MLRRLAGPAYGSPGPQPGFNRLLQTDEGTARVVATLSYLLHGPGEVSERLEGCLTGEHKLPGVGEAIMAKALAVADPQRWIPSFVTRGKVGKLVILGLLGGDQPAAAGAAAAAIASNDAVRALLEYREEEIRLLYSDVLFSLPANLQIIATMNTADRSIALVDAALRRRFHFVPFFPDRPPIDGLLRRWLGDRQPDMLWVADVVDRANDLLADRNVAIGPSHFLKPRLTVDLVVMAWEGSVLPFLEDHFFSDPDLLRGFDLQRLRDAGPIDGPARGQSAAEPEPPQP